tara:strand:+ start:3562 stop:3774 length:213 start_codon:yes stop_codon:yes gene_type:complete
VEINGFRSGEKELYNLKTDPKESNNVFDLNPKIGKKLISKLVKWEKNECYSILRNQITNNLLGLFYFYIS